MSPGPPAQVSGVGARYGCQWWPSRLGLLIHSESSELLVFRAAFGPVCRWPDRSTAGALAKPAHAAARRTASRPPGDVAGRLRGSGDAGSVERLGGAGVAADRVMRQLERVAL